MTEWDSIGWIHLIEYLPCWKRPGKYCREYKDESGTNKYVGKMDMENLLEER